MTRAEFSIPIFHILRARRPLDLWRVQNGRERRAVCVRVCAHVSMYVCVCVCVYIPRGYSRNA